jgi:hypothetical protein
MNKYTKNQLWFNIEKIICFTVASAFLILMIACITTSCTTSSHLCDKYATPKTTYDCPLFTN